MPKKTRKEKLRADVRHKSFALPMSEPPSSLSPILPATFQFRSARPTTGRNEPEDAQELGAIRSDLTRTIVLALIAFSIELSLYWRFFRM